MAFKRDLIVVSVDPDTKATKYYQISEDDWRKAPAVTCDLAVEIDEMVKSGGVLAAINEGGGIGAACYLINLSVIKVDGQ